MITSTFSRCSEKNGACNEGKITPRSTLSLRDYNAEDRAVAIELFKEGMLDGIDREKDERMYNIFESWADSVLYKYDDIPSMVYSRNGGRLLVARDEKNEVVGTVGIIVSDDDLKKKRGELVRLSVRKKSRGKGIGKYLLSFLINYAKNELKLSALHLETSNVFVSAIGLYVKYGFKESSRGNNSDTSISIYMELNLNSLQ